MCLQSDKSFNPNDKKVEKLEFHHFFSLKCGHQLKSSVLCENSMELKCIMFCQKKKTQVYYVKMYVEKLHKTRLISKMENETILNPKQMIGASVF